MASAQVLPNTAASSTRKQEHLEAGKRRLEEFRKKKAADRAKKAAPASHLHGANVDHQHEKQPLENQHVRLTDSNGAGPSDGVSETVVEPCKEVTDDGNKENMFVLNNELGSNDKYAKPPLPRNYYNAFSEDIAQAPPKDQEFDRYNASHSAGSVNVKYSHQPQGKSDDFSISARASGRHAYGIANSNEQSVGFGSQVIRESDHDSSQTSHYGSEEAHSALSDAFASDLSSAYSGGFPVQNKSAQTSGLMSSIDEDSVRPPMKTTMSSFGVGKNLHAAGASNDSLTFDTGERKLGNSVGHFPSGNSQPFWTSESPSTPFNFGAASSYNNGPLDPAVSEPASRRSRPSFLDSINMTRVPLTEPGTVEPNSSEVNDMDAVTSSYSQTPNTDPETTLSFSKMRASNVPNAFEHSMKRDSYSQKQDDDFAALEQHIEDLTQEKFSLQRALEASRTLSDSLAAENSTLTDSYNQQGSVVHNLKSDMEMLQEEIKAQLLELDSLKMEYANAQLECNAADERAKLLASEVIGLEEKALRLRSSELKLERQLENSQAEISSLKRKMSSIEKERQDLQSTINALVEEKKLLQSKLRKASSNVSVGVSKNHADRKDVSTSTEDLVDEADTETAEVSNLEMDSTAPHLRSDASGSFLLPEGGQFDLQVSYLNIPPDQTRTIHNINTLISELALEKEELMKALMAESSESSKLKDLNTELSRKLEAQTQRLELLTAQSMAKANVPMRLPDPRSLDDNTPFADEGDEVVERVLGWIMKLFPGGPSRRRPSKLL
ncbi:protein BLISTER isoform X2 [Rhododendron vialii]|uniref:protein BLISTER isoform X2 n=1 Tax=Rhododendron vialii TaxID=182163 RepID=UPI00265E3214|nr:protein BLISTER isoform X2 [Rhododendron vialii]